MAVYKRGKIWWYKFVWNGAPIRESTKQTNKRVAEQMEAAHRTSLAKAEVGIRDRTSTPTIQDFVESDFIPFIQARFQHKPNTLAYYRDGWRTLDAHAPLARCALDAVTTDKIGTFVAKLRRDGLCIGSINRRLEVLRRLLKLATEWGKVQKILPKIEMLPGENHRERVLSEEEETRYLAGAAEVGDQIQATYQHALEGIRAKKRGEHPLKPEDPFILRDVTTLLIDCGLRPDECFRLRWEHVREGAIHVPFGKTENARRTIPLTPRLTAFLQMRRAAAKTEWVFPAQTKSGHIEKSSLKKQHARACKLAKVADFVLYTFRHTCLTRWAAYMDPYTLAYLAGHSDFSTTRRYVHPQVDTIREAMDRVRKARGGHNSGHSDLKPVQGTNAGNAANGMNVGELVGRGEWIRTTDLLVPNQAL